MSGFPQSGHSSKPKSVFSKVCYRPEADVRDQTIEIRRTDYELLDFLRTSLATIGDGCACLGAHYFREKLNLKFNP